MNDHGDRRGRRLRRTLLLAALVTIVLLAAYSTLHMERGATSRLDEGDDPRRPMPSPVTAPSPSTEADDPAADNYDDIAPGTFDEGADEARPDELPGRETPGETAPDTGSVTEADDQWKEEDHERQ